MFQRKPKPIGDAMNTEIHTPNSSVKSSITASYNPSETRDGSYFPGCRKDANCKCEICIASINATLDLMPHSGYRSPHAKFSSSRPAVSRSPISFNPFSTPKSSHRLTTVADSSPPGSAESRDSEEKVIYRNRNLGIRVFVVRLLWGLILGLSLEIGIGWIVPGVREAKLSPSVVQNMGENSINLENLSQRSLFLKNEIETLVGEQVSSCSSDDSLWEIREDGTVLNSVCVLYKSATEEVSIWGWPLQTSGLLVAEHSSRSFTITSGSVAEWSNVESKFVIRKGNNSSWTQGKWSAAVVQMEPNTWILEYRRSFLADNTRLVSAAAEFLKIRLLRELRKMARVLWVPPAVDNWRYEWWLGRSSPVPTPT